MTKDQALTHYSWMATTATAEAAELDALWDLRGSLTVAIKEANNAAWPQLAGIIGESLAAVYNEIDRRMCELSGVKE